MALPDAPVTRNEQYLNAIATGDTSGLPAVPITREEMYLAHIAENGSGGGSGGSTEPLVVTLTITSADYSGTYDKPWEDIVAAYESGRKVIADSPAMNAFGEVTYGAKNNGQIMELNFLVLALVNGTYALVRFFLTSTGFNVNMYKVTPLA